MTIYNVTKVTIRYFKRSLRCTETWNNRQVTNDRILHMCNFWKAEDAN
jgi:hypothetical protein